MQDPLDNIPLSKNENQNIFLPTTEKMTLELLEKYQNSYPTNRQLKSRHKYKTKSIKADIILLGNKTLLRYFRKFNNTTINENTDHLEDQIPETKLPCLPLSMILIAFHISHSMQKNMQVHKKKDFQTSFKVFYFQRLLLDKNIMQCLYKMSIK